MDAFRGHDERLLTDDSMEPWGRRSSEGDGKGSWICGIRRERFEECGHPVMVYITMARQACPCLRHHPAVPRSELSQMGSEPLKRSTHPPVSADPLSSHLPTLWFSAHPTTRGTPVTRSGAAKTFPASDVPPLRVPHYQVSPTAPLPQKTSYCISPGTPTPQFHLRLQS